MDEVETSSHGDSDEEWTGVDEEVSISSRASCLFCVEIFDEIEQLFAHCHAQHMFDIVNYSSKKQFNCILYIKFINYIRFHNPSSCELMELPVEMCPWSGDEYMKPVDASDPLLTFDIESFVLEKLAERGDEEETVTLPRSRFESILQKLANKEMKLQNAFDRIDKMKEAAKNVLFENSKSSSTYDNCNSSYNESDIYFSTYDHFAIHHEMLQDKVRTTAYQDAILKNKKVFENKSVLDVGCGTAILSLFAASAGASKVLAVDKSDVVYQAMDIVRENLFEHVIDFYKGRVEDAHVPEGKFDVIVSEWMGYFLLFEGMLDSVLYARDHFLASGGSMFPDRCCLYMFAISDMERHEELISFWDNVYGFKMSVMKKDVAKEANVEMVKKECVCSDIACVKELDLMTCNKEDAEFSQEFELTMSTDCAVTSMAGYFDCFFEKDLEHKVVLSTSPHSTATHWKQTTFLLPEIVNVSKGEKILCKLACRKNRRDPRSLIVNLTFGNVSNKYYLS